MNTTMKIPIELVNHIVMMSVPEYPFLMEMKRICRRYYYNNTRTFTQKYRSTVINGIRNFGHPRTVINGIRKSNYVEHPLVLEFVFESIKHKYNYFRDSKFTLGDIKNKRVHLPLKVLIQQYNF
tara:strand:+ start:171 stop:542 length:372 start_codon:yes stop_codon:yes gene_type:complete